MTIMLPCPLCRGNDTRSIYRRSGFKYYQCRRCCLLFLYPFPTTKQLALYYSQFTNSVPTRLKKISKQATSVIKTLTQLNHSGRTLLDVGSGYGLMLKAGKEKGLKVLGIEPSVQLQRYSRRLNLKVLRRTVNQYLDQNKRTFDFITLSHVIEHLPNPKTVINRLVKMLNPHGILFIETPNLQSHLYQIEKNNSLFLIPPEHLWVFSFRSIYAMIKNTSSVKTIFSRTYSHPEHLMGIVKTLFKTRPDRKPDSALNQSLDQQSIFKKIKYQLCDCLIAPLLTPLLNLKQKGSILEIYFQKT